MIKVIAISASAALTFGLVACSHPTSPCPKMMPPTPPKYLSVKHWKHCVKTEKMGSYKVVCLPMHRPHHCPSRSWKALTSSHMDLGFCKR